MTFAPSENVRNLQSRVSAFMEQYVYPTEDRYEREVSEGDRWQPIALIEELKARAKEQGLWNLFLPDSQYGAGLTNAEYAPLCEIMGRVLWASEVFNCSAPDTGNMEVLVRYGTDAQKEAWLEPLLRGEIRSAFAMTEPLVASSDATNIESSIERDGDEYVINGQKIFTSLATDADYIWLAVRTDQNVKKHKGISIIIVPTDTPGFKCEPISNMGGFNTNATFYEDIHVPVGNLVGEENQGWNLITNQLNHERVTLCASGIVERQLEDVIDWAKLTRLADGRRVIDQEWVQLNLARVHARLDYLRLANWKIADGATRGEALDPAAASAIKVFGTEFYLEAFRLLMEILGPIAPVKGNSPEAVLHGRLEARTRSMHILTFGGGTNEMQRDLIAIFGLGMPGSPR
jgi:alkylation response protein AidB-like acyl-CoA dehydrogenase